MTREVKKTSQEKVLSSSQEKRVARCLLLLGGQVIPGQRGVAIVGLGKNKGQSGRCRRTGDAWEKLP